jgi:hypothetical protein
MPGPSAAPDQASDLDVQIGGTEANAAPRARAGASGPA